MNSNSTPTLFITKITKHLHWAEGVFLLGLVIGTILMLTKIDSSVTSVSLIGLAATFFLYSYKPIDIPQQENEKAGFSALLTFVIAPKVMWISSAVSVIGLLFYVLDMEAKGYLQMFMIGGSSIAIGVLIFTFALVTGVKHLRVVAPILLRAVPLLLVDMYLLLK